MLKPGPDRADRDSMIDLVWILAAVAALSVGYRLGPYIFDGFVSRRYEELFRRSDVWDIDQRFERVLLEYADGH
jgi:hypothetical protein